VTFALDGYQSQTVTVQPRPPIDPRESVGKVQFDPNPVYVELEAAPAPAKKKPIAKKRKPNTEAKDVTPG